MPKPTTTPAPSTIAIAGFALIGIAATIGAHRTAKKQPPRTVLVPDDTTQGAGSAYKIDPNLTNAELHDGLRDLRHIRVLELTRLLLVPLVLFGIFISVIVSQWSGATPSTHLAAGIGALGIAGFSTLWWKTTSRLADVKIRRDAAYAHPNYRA